MSSHREAPETAKDPVADSTDTYAFVSPDNPGTVTILTNYIPFESPDGGPNFYEFGDDVLYSIHISNRGDARSDITYQFKFNNVLANRNTFLYNTGPIKSLADPNWNKRQFYSVTRIDRPRRGHRLRTRHLGRNLASPPCNIGPRSTPDYPSLAQAAVHSLPGGMTVFAGQRNDGFLVDLGSVFDLADVRPFQELHVIPSPPSPGVDALKGLNVHTIALQIPIHELTRDGSTPTDPASALSTIGVWASASRRKMRLRGDDESHEAGPWVQVSRLANPLFNELLVPISRKDDWNSRQPYEDKAFASGVEHPELARLLPQLYPTAFPNLAKLTAPRADLAAILLTGIPPGIVPGFQNFTGNVMADMVRLNMAIPPSANPSPLGILGGDLAGFPNGRRVTDDVVTIELRAVAGATYPLVNKSYTPDAAASAVTDGVTPGPGRYLSTFPYLGLPHDGYSTPAA